MHIDDFIEDYRQDHYARWVLFHTRLPANLAVDFRKFMVEYKLYCTYAGKRYRVTGGSRMGDVWLNSDLDKDYGHELRVNDILQCTKWSKDP